MGTDEIDPSAAETLVRFFAAMNAWGHDMLRHHRSIDWGSDGIDQDALALNRANQRGSLEAIFREFCEVGTGARRLRDAGLSFADPPEYDPDSESILAVSMSRGVIVIETRESRGFRFDRRYELVNLSENS